jgi:hypothetical protein
MALAHELFLPGTRMAPQAGAISQRAPGEGKRIPARCPCVRAQPSSLRPGRAAA